MCLPVPPIPHIVVPFTLTVSLKSGWGFRHRTETEGVKVPFATITTIPNIQTALFIQPTAIGTVYEDLGGNHEYQLRLTQPNAKEASSSRTIGPISDVTLPTRLGLRPIALHQLPLTSATLHLLSALLSHFQPTRTRAISFSFQDCGSILLAVGWLDYIVITHMCPNLLNIFAREPQWAIWWSNQDLHLTHTMLTPYIRHYRSSHALVVHPSLSS